MIFLTKFINKIKNNLVNLKFKMDQSLTITIKQKRVEVQGTYDLMKKFNLFEKFRKYQKFF
jgi:hypothetical protein